MSITTWSGVPALRKALGNGKPTQQPDWADPAIAYRVTGVLAQMPALVRPQDVDELVRLLARAASGELSVFQFGDCAEDPAQDVERYVPGVLRLGRELLDAASLRTDDAVLVGRIAGQYAKPRSESTEWVEGREVPSYRGHLVNRPHAEGRSHDAWHMMTCFGAAQQVMVRLGWCGYEGPISPESHLLWTSHEALVLDYERALIRPSREGPYLSSTHWPWIGARTRDPRGPHVQFLARLGNPIAVKVGPDTTAADVLALCSVLNPDRIPGRLTLISRMGAGRVADALGPLIDAVQDAGHQVLWMCDPMHGNTHKTSAGTKVRYVEEIITEAHAFLDTVLAHGAHPGGLHLEATTEDVLECQASLRHGLTGLRTSLCDPRLNLEQAREVVAEWSTRIAIHRPPRQLEAMA